MTITSRQAWAVLMKADSISYDGKMDNFQWFISEDEFKIKSETTFIFHKDNNKHIEFDKFLGFNMKTIDYIKIRIKCYSEIFPSDF